MTVAESTGAPLEMAAGLQLGIDTISQQQVIVFTKYTRMVLPLDSFVFWVKTSLLSDSALFNSSPLNTAALNSSPTESAALTINAQGSLHFSSDKHQDEDQNATYNTMIFTSESEINDFNEISANEMYIAEHDGIRFGFNTRSGFYRQSGLSHYRGMALYPAMATQVIDVASGFDAQNVIVSNSLPIWLALASGVVPYPGSLTWPGVPLYPSFAVPDNLPPIYGSVHIEPGDTQAMTSAPVIDSNFDSSQLCKDTVRITLYGTRNYSASDFRDYIFDYSLNTDAIGIMNVPVLRDEKRTQSELGILAMKKTITFEVSYYQERVRDIARQFIKSAFVTLNFA